MVINRLKKYQSKENLIKDSFRISHDLIKKRIRIDLKPEFINGIQFSSHLWHMLGFKEADVTQFVKENEMDKKETHMWGDYQINLNPVKDTLFVYTDFIQPSIMSNTQARLLRVINGSGPYGQLLTKTFIIPYYIPVSLNVINSVEIEIKDSMDRHIRFAYGVTVLVLHFKKKKSLIALE